jgi:DNA-binding CsgD family transcriptional regulator
MGLAKGIAFLSVRTFVLERFGPKTWDAFIDALSPESRTALANVLPAQWYPAARLSALLRAIDAHVGRGDLALLGDLGRFEAERELSSVMRWFFRVTPPNFAVRQLDLHWRRSFEAGSFTSEALERTFVARQSGWTAADEALCRTVVGYLQRTLELTVSAGVEVDHPRCRTHGHPACEFAWTLPKGAPPRPPLAPEDIHEIGREVVQITEPETLGRAIAEVLIHDFACEGVAVWKAQRRAAEPKLLHTTLLHTTLLHATGASAGEARIFPLEVQGRDVGRLEIRPRDLTKAEDAEAFARLDDLLPWLALALSGTHAPSEDLDRRITRVARRWGLSAKEREILAQIARGRSPEDVAERLDLEGATVERKVAQILEKAGVDGRTALLAELWTTS